MAVDPRWQQLQAAFATELEERVRELTGLLVRLERGEDDDAVRHGIVDALFREAHSLKGAARAVELRQVEQLAHALESALETVRRGGVRPTGSWFDAAYRAIDAFTPLAAGANGDGSAEEDLQNVLAGLQAPHLDERRRAEPPRDNGHGAPVPSPAPAPASPPQAAATVPVVGSGGAGSGRPAPDSVRVAVGKLDALLAQAGELAVTHIRIGQRLDEVRVLRDDLERWRREWRGTRGLRNSLRRSAAQAVPSGPAKREPRPAGEVDALLRLVDAAEQRLQAMVESITLLSNRLRDDTAQLGLVTRGIGDDVMAVRLLPVATVFAPLERLVRDLARDAGKEIFLAVYGNEEEIDRKILEGLRDPLMHLVRNAVDHGIEPPDEREARGKARSGTITLSATRGSGRIEFLLEDDGRGLDPAALRAVAVRKGLLTDQQAAALADSSALELIFQPGFSTREVVTATSGRGVGMDVVREHVQRLGGHLTVSSIAGQGARFVIVVPLTLATTRALLVEQSGQLLALPTLLIERTARKLEEQIRTVEGSRVVPIEGVAVPIVELAEVLGWPRVSAPPEAEGQWRPLVVVRHGERRLALLVGRLVGEQEIVIKRLGWPLGTVRNVSGAAVLGSGQTVVILNPAHLLATGLQVVARHGGGVQPAVARDEGTGSTATDRRRSRLLVVEDSLTTRTLEISILEAAGYEVVAAVDGLDALQVLRNQAIDLVVSDVEMPRLDGFALTTEIRREEKLRDIPVILVTSLETHEHRAQGAAVGADAYVIKSQFDQGQLWIP